MKLFNFLLNECNGTLSERCLLQNEIICGKNSDFMVDMKESLVVKTSKQLHRQKRDCYEVQLFFFLKSVSFAYLTCGSHKNETNISFDMKTMTL